MPANHPSLEVVLDLAIDARRSPHAKQVLFDALNERYGDAFLGYLLHVRRVADRNRRAMMVFLRPDVLAQIDAAEWPALSYRHSALVRSSPQTLPFSASPLRGLMRAQHLVTVRPSRSA